MKKITNLDPLLKNLHFIQILKKSEPIKNPFLGRVDRPVVPDDELEQEEHSTYPKYVRICVCTGQGASQVPNVSRIKLCICVNYMSIIFNSGSKKGFGKHKIRTIIY